MPTLLINDGLIDAEAILFDKDGTLVEFHELWIGTTKNRLEELSRQLKERGKPPLSDDEKRDLAALLGVPDAHRGIGRGRVDPCGPLIMSGPADHETLAAGFIYQRRGEPFNETLIFTREAFKAALAQQRPKLLDGAAEVLKALRANQWVLGIVTNDGEEETKGVLARIGLKEMLHAIVCAHEQTVHGVTKRIRKPDAEMVTKFCLETGIVPSATILVADSHNDLKMGPAAGCAATVGVRSGVDTDEWLNKASPTTILDSVADMLGMILTIRRADTASAIDALNTFYASPIVDYAGQAATDDAVLIAELGAKLVGGVRVCEEGGHRVLRGMHVHPQYQCRGIGKRLLAALEPLMMGASCWCLPFSHLEAFYATAAFRPVPSANGPPHLQKRLNDHRASGADLIMMVRDGA